MPESDDLPPIKDLLATALANRSDLAAEQLGVTSSEISALGTRNGILPLLVGIASESTAGLSGTPQTSVTSFGVETSNPYFNGGIGNALGAGFAADFPTNRIAAYFQTPLRNDQAQADFAIDQLQLRQSQIQLSKDLNQVAVDVSNYLWLCGKPAAVTAQRSKPAFCSSNCWMPNKRSWPAEHPRPSMWFSSNATCRGAIGRNCGLGRFQ